VHYERAGFSDPEPMPHQQSFALSIDEFLAHRERVATRQNTATNVGIGAHSLRAVSSESLQEIVRVANDSLVPMHLHIAEQQREVEQCLATYGRRPVRWLLENFDVGRNWCLVHATHMDTDEISGLARSGAVVALCPSTEANLGDGLFPLQRFLQREGQIAIGSDSHVSINPFEELRWLEYGQRLVTQQRNIAAIRRNQTGRSLFELAAEGGSLATGQAGGRIRAGDNADLIVLDDDSPMLVGHSTRSLLDALVFSGFTLPIDRVMVRGEWQVIDGRHKDAVEARAGYAEVARKLYRDEMAS
jgi:formimidoylglutamate deiminase